MGPDVRARWRSLVEGLWFVPSLIVVALGGLSFALVQLDADVVGHGTPWVFGGDASAARTVFETIAGSLITVAGLTFSVTMVVMQLASSQFSPRVLPNFLGDRMTQATVGVFVGIFVFCLIGLRAVGGVEQFVPRLTVTVASALGVAAVILLIGFIHHISTMIQVSHVSARIGRRTLQQLDQLHPEPFGEGLDEDGEALLEEWRSEGRPGRVLPDRPGYVQQVALDEIASTLDGRADRVHLTVAPGDFVSVEMPVAEVWPRSAAAACAGDVRRRVTITSERNFAQDVDFGVRQLTDIALRAISPSVNDPTTAVTCIGYIRSVLERLAGRTFPSRVRRWDDRDLVAVARRRSFDEYLAVLVEIGRYADGDIRVVGALLAACRGVATAAGEAGAHERAEAARRTGQQLAERARSGTDSELAREEIDALLEELADATRVL